MEYLLDMWPLVAALIAVIGWAFWWSWRKKRREGRAHVQELAAMAAQLGGTLAGPENAAAWSANLCPAFKNDTGGATNTMLTIGLQGARFDAAVDFQRGHWRVRVSEASMVKRTPTGSADANKFHEHRIDIVTAQLPPVRVCRLWRGEAPTQDPPASVAQQGGAWQRLPIQGPADSQLAVFASDLGAASHLINQEVLDYLTANLGLLPVMLNFEHGLCYGTMLNQIAPRTIVNSVDAVIGMLERIPGANPVRR